MPIILSGEKIKGSKRIYYPSKVQTKIGHNLKIVHPCTHKYGRNDRTLLIGKMDYGFNKII